MKVVLSVLAAAVIVVAVVSSASGHNMSVTHPKTGEVIHSGWIGGPAAGLPPAAQGQGLAFHPAPGQNQPAGHREGLPHACEGTQSSPAVTITAPPFGSCVHGQP
jgi:hypothetical protein